MKTSGFTQRLGVTFMLLLALMSCQKEELLTKDQEAQDSALTTRNSENGQLKQTKTFSSDVITQWLNMQLDLLRVPLAPGAGSQAADRALVYCGLAAYESVVPGMPAYQTLTGQLTDYPHMPETVPGKPYHWAASANAALAEMNRQLFPNASAANKAKINDLENTLKATYIAESDLATVDRSVVFGKAVAAAIFGWAVTDGSANPNPPYMPPVGPGLWVSTPPNFPAAANPYASQRRQIVMGSYNGASLTPPPAYDTLPGSAFYSMVNNVYTKSLALTPEQIAMALYHRDAPGYPGGGTFSAILSQVIVEADCKLDVAALAYVKLGLGAYEALTLAFINKYTYNLVRPITYIRNVMGHTTWTALFNTPGHPEFPAAHATSGGVVAIMLTNVFGDQFDFTLDHYAYLGLPARDYDSFEALGTEMGNSRVYAGIHYQPSIDKGYAMSKKVCNNILSKVNFLKE